MRILIIPARGGSKGILKKNLQKVNGISLIERAIKTSLKSSVDKIIVSTNDLEIKNIAKKYDVALHDRSEENSSDEATTEAVIFEVIKDFEKNWKSDVTLGIYQVTSAFVQANTINDCFELSEKGFSAFSAISFHGFLWEKKDSWTPLNHPLNFRPRRQELNQRVKETGAIYTFPLQDFKIKGFRFCTEAKPVLVNSTTSLEIDDSDDLKLSNIISLYFDELNILDYSLPKIIFTDFDGCLTNDRVKVNMFGRETVVVNRKDGLAISRLRKLGIKVIIATTETNEVVEIRAKKMKVESLRGLENKVDAISNYLESINLNWSDIWYIGNDVNDLGAIKNAAVSFCPSDAAPEILGLAKVVLSRRGGEGVLAEIASRLESVNK